MRTRILSTMLCVFSLSMLAQINTISVVEKKEVLSTKTETEYNPAKNCPYKAYHLLIGQELYVLPLPKDKEIYSQLRSSGYKGFKTVKFNVKKDKDTAKRYGKSAPNNKNNTAAEELENKIFVVKGFDKSDDQYPLYCLHLIEKDNPLNECKYVFKFDTEFDITFATMSHYEFLKNKCIGKNYYFDESCLRNKDSKTGENIWARSNHSWECKDIIISPESGKLTMLLGYKNSETYLYEYAGSMEHSTRSSVLESLAGSGGTATQDLDQFIVTAYSPDAWERNVKEYGEEMMWQALNHKVAIGMPVKLVIKALGRAVDGNSASYGTQMVYKIDYKKLVATHCVPFVKFQNGRDEMYVYIDNNGLVTGWN